MQDHAFISQISFVGVDKPIGGADMDFNVPVPMHIIDYHAGFQKIRASIHIFVAGPDHGNALLVVCEEICAFKILEPPNKTQDFFIHHNKGTDTGDLLNIALISLSKPD
jgi:hypothetical protein